jgi:hypothetical protein
MKAITSHFFTFHVDVLTAEKLTMRFTFSNMFKEVKSLGKSIQIPLKLNPRKWTGICLDVPALMKEHPVERYVGVDEKGGDGGEARARGGGGHACMCVCKRMHAYASCGRL